MGLSRQEYWGRLPLPSPGGLPHPGIEPPSSALAGRLFTTEPPLIYPSNCPASSKTSGSGQTRSTEELFQTEGHPGDVTLSVIPDQDQPLMGNERPKRTLLSQLAARDSLERDQWLQGLSVLPEHPTPAEGLWKLPAGHLDS